MYSLNRRQVLSGLTMLAVAPALTGNVLAQNTVNWKAWRNGQDDFFRAPVLLTGSSDAILIDGSFNFPAGKAVAEEIRASGKNLTTIFVTCNDPDYYFSLKPIKEAFPEAKVLAAPDTVEALTKKAAGKLKTWGPVLGENGPQSMADLIIPDRYDETYLELEGVRIEIVNSTRLADRRYLWVPEIEAAFGGVYAFEGLHVWTADSPKPEDRANWVAELEDLIARNPKVVVAGHAASGTNNGVNSLEFTRDYLIAYEMEVGKAKDSTELIAAMKALYPGLGLEAALEIGAKVAKGEMSWG